MCVGEWGDLVLGLLVAGGTWCLRGYVHSCAYRVDGMWIWKKECGVCACVNTRVHI